MMLTLSATGCATSTASTDESSALTRVSDTTEAETAPDTSFLRTWKAGTVITEAQARAAGTLRLFTISTIDEGTKARMMGKSYREDCRVPLQELRLIRVAHRNAKGQTQLGEMVCNRIIASKLIRIFTRLYEAGYRIESIRLIDEFDADDEKSMTANNSSCFCYREVSGTSTLSKHSLGLAVDINTLYNPYVVTRNGRTHIEPAAGEKYAFNREKRDDIPYKIDSNDLATRLFKAEGFKWGGDWNTVKDYQHFEFPDK